jgi:hypothetical protein
VQFFGSIGQNIQSNGRVVLAEIKAKKLWDHLANILEQELECFGLSDQARDVDALSPPNPRVGVPMSPYLVVHGCLSAKLVRLTTGAAVAVNGKIGMRRRLGMERAVFEQELEAQLVALVEALRAADIDRDQALAAFYTAAWSAWEASEAPTGPEVTFQEQPRTLSPLRRQQFRAGGNSFGYSRPRSI